jgi:hypothetical protein
MDKYLAAFKQMKDIDKKEVKKLTLQGAELILASAKRKCTSTNVRNALGFITKNDAKYPYTTLIGLKPEFRGNANGAKNLTIPALAVILEYGTVERITKDGSSRGISPAKPYLRPAIDENRSKVIGLIQNGLIAIVEKQANKII